MLTYLEKIKNYSKKLSRFSTKVFFVVFFLAATIVFFVPNKVNAANLLFRTGFEANSGPFNTVLSDITGTDNSVGSPNNWSNLGFDVGYNCGNETDRWARIVDDPTRVGNRVMHFWLSRTELCGANTRVSTSLWGGTERFQRVRMYLHPDMLKLIGSGLPGGWFMFQELWIRPNWTGQANSFRISFNLERGNVNGAEKFYWKVDSNECCAGMVGQDGTTFWAVTNKTIPVPIGEWFTAETYYKMGDANNGRITFSIQRDGQPKQVVADITNWTYHPEEGPQGIDLWSPHKLYVRPDNVDYVRNKGGALQIYWDNWELWDGMPGTTTPTPTPTPNPTPEPTPTQSVTYENHSIANQTGSFTAEFDAKPTQANSDVVFGLSNGAADAYTDLAPIFRFNPANQIDVRNGSAYTAQTTLNYATNTSYHVKLEVNVPNKTYNAYVTPQGGTQTTIAQNYAFRSEQSSVTSLNNWTKATTTGGAEITNFTVSSSPSQSCGDQSCNNGETCSTCPGDCGTCPPAAKKYTLTDFTNLVTDWLKTLSGSPADVNLDNKVNSRDLGIMMSNWQ